MKQIFFLHKIYNSFIIRNIYFVDRFGEASVSNPITHQLSSGKNLVFSFPFLSPLLLVVGGEQRERKNLDFFGRYLISNVHFLWSPYQIYQCNLFYLLIIVKNSCIQFSYCIISVALQLRDWMCVGEIHPITK